MNDLPDKMNTGALGELLVQIRLLQLGVQAAPPIKDSGNDLIAVRNDVFKAIQVKTTKRNRYSAKKLPKRYHLLAVVKLCASNGDVCLSRSHVFLIPKDKVSEAPRTCAKLSDYRLTREYVNYLFEIQNSCCESHLQSYQDAPPSTF
jgi:hypothetical protein